jgi:hypothetical protein
MSQEPGEGLHLVLDVQYDGLPVWGAEVAAHFAADGALTSINAQKLGTLRPAMTLRYGPAAAQQRARRGTPRGLPTGRCASSASRCSGCGRGAAATMAGCWRGSSCSRSAAPTACRSTTRPTSTATPGRCLARHALVHTEKVSATTGSATNLFGKPVTLRISNYEDKGYFALFDRSKGLAAATLQTFDADHTQYDASLATSNNKASWGPALATAHDHMQKVVDYYSKTHGRNSWDGQGAQVKQLVHYGQDFNNAFWDAWSKHMAIGDGDAFTFKSFARALDVSAHEFSHAVVTGTVDLVYQGQPGALNESFADVIAVMVDRDDWLIGEEIVGPQVFPQGYARSFIDPEGGNQPAHMDQLYKGLDDFGGVHINSGIPNHAAYLLAQAKSREVVEKIWYRTLYKDHIGSQASFVDMAQGTLTACDELVAAKTLTAGDCTATAQAWVKVGVLGAADVPMGGCPTNASEAGRRVLLRPGLRAEQGRQRVRGGRQRDVPAERDRGQRAVLLQGRLQAERGQQPVRGGRQGLPAQQRLGRGGQGLQVRPGFEGSPNAADGKCEAVDSDCPTNAHPIFDEQQMGHVRVRLQRQLRGRRHGRLPGGGGDLRQRVVLRPL